MNRGICIREYETAISFRRKESLAFVAGEAFGLDTEEGKELSFEAGVLANRLLYPDYDSDEALDYVHAELKRYQAVYERLRQEKEEKEKTADPTED